VTPRRLIGLAAALGACGFLAGCMGETGGQIRTYTPWFTSTYAGQYQSIATCAARELQRWVVISPVYVESEKRALLSASGSYPGRYGEVLYAVWEAEIKQIDAKTARVEVKRTASPNENSSHWQNIRDIFDRCGGQRLS